MQNTDEQTDTTKTDGPIDQQTELNKLNAEPTSLSSTSSGAVQGASAPEIKTTEPVHVSNYIAPQSRTPFKGLLFAVAVVLLVVLVSAGGVAYWYFGMRTADREYDKAIAVIDSMADTTKSIESNKKITPPNGGAVKTSAVLTNSITDAVNGTEATLERLDSARDKAAEYVVNQRILASLPVITKDESIKAVYSTNKKVIDEYGTSSDEFFRSGYVFMAATAHCFGNNPMLTGVDVTLVEYDSDMKLCTDYLATNKTAASKQFNDTVYVPYRKFLLQMITSSRTLLSTSENSKEFMQAVKDLNNAAAELRKVDMSKLDQIKPTQDPRSQLQRLKNKIIERKTQFIR